jgi:hypothetical protein
MDAEGRRCAAFNRSNVPDREPESPRWKNEAVYVFGLSAISVILRLVRRPYGLHAIPAIIQSHASHKARGPIASEPSGSRTHHKNSPVIDPNARASECLRTGNFVA